MESKTTDVQTQPKASVQPWAAGGFALVRRLRVQALTGFSRSTLYNRISAGLFPRPVSLGGRAVGWPEREIEIVNAARIAGRSDDTIRVLVARLVDAREGADRASGEPL